MHGEHAADLPDGVRFIHGERRRPQRGRSALEGVDAVVHLAAAVGVGQSMYEIERYVAVNTSATATFLEQRRRRGRAGLERLVVASSMSIYGEGEYDCADARLVAPPPRPEEQLLARQWECLCPHCGRSSRPIPTRRDASR